MKNELDPRLLSVIGLNPFVANNSGMRMYMFNSHLSQALVINGATENRIQSGLEQEFGKYTFNVRMPCNGRVLAVLNKFPTNTITEDFKENPCSYIIFENLDKDEIDYLEIPTYKSFHTTFGFPLKINDSVINNLSTDSIIEKDTILADSVNVTDTGGYKYGTELNICYMSHPAVAEDGVVVSKSALKKLSFTKYESRSISFGEKYFPLNIYGDKNNYKPFPDIGEKVRPDSLLVALRSYEDDISPAILGVEDCMNPDYVFDNMVYASSPESIIVDMNIVYNPNSKYALPTGMDDNLKKYVNANYYFYKRLLDIEASLRSKRFKKYGSSKVNFSYGLHRLLVEAHIMTDHGGTTASTVITKKYRNEPIDTYRIEFVLATPMTPGVGFKISGTAGDKGIIVAVEDDENMPIDKDGVRADIIADDVSPVNRMNISKLYSQYIGIACYRIKYMLRDVLGLDHHKTFKNINSIKEMINPERLQIMANIILDFYKIVSQEMYDGISQLPTDQLLEHVAYVTVNGPYLYIPTNHTISEVDMVRNIRDKYKIYPDKVLLSTGNGKMEWSKNNIFIGPIYVMLLEKIGDSWSAMASGKYQHYGVLGPSSQFDKYQYPYRNVSVRTISETESRIYRAYTEPMNIAEIMDRNSNSISHKEVVKSIMDAEKPTNINQVIDRKKIAFGSVKPLQYTKHVMLCAGIKIVYKDSDKLLNYPTYYNDYCIPKVSFNK